MIKVKFVTGPWAGVEDELTVSKVRELRENYQLWWMNANEVHAEFLYTKRGESKGGQTISGLAMEEE